ncbi:hypothetical protein HMPREF1991_02768 [Hoylesella loescheii DSM 19665 = JCM 12249 = ATCC 15930]|uniref:Uncharacterized protein n=1 Tax=Hoylesella loescheii DSM 19665 = JCM 12249 = ATCC 15930 TaxID=1122985 RepID=A0A069QEJ7_HOYLO|nr:hypothetical protein HMPREF1991_02768 [Hoylesella loescheii DSM 19665 = JCM 12249 = ATCC 15930]
MIHNKSRTGRTCSGLLHVRSNIRKEVYAGREMANTMAHNHLMACAMPI